MATIKQLLKTVSQFSPEKVAVSSLEETSDNIADLNVEQMMSGITADGTDIIPYYKDVTIFIKQGKGQPTDRVTLRDTGSFQQGTTTRITSSLVITDSSDSKAESLKKKYGEKIFGLSDKYKAEYLREFLNPAFLRQCKLTLRL